ncbi:MAG: enoyl-CoA hydratase/isomerase family protein [Ferrimicrobium sp.]
MALVELEHRGPIGWVTLNRPDKLNALNEELVEELLEILTRIRTDDSIRVMVLTGSGRAFSAGFDLAEDEEPSTADTDGWHQILTRDVEVTMMLWEFPKPTIAAVRGWCLAGGCELAMACDMIVATQDARFGEPEIRYGSGPTTLLMPFVLGQKKTNELLFTGDTIGASEAERLGLINQVVADDVLDPATTELAQRVALAPATVLRLTKLALIRAYEAMGLRQAVNANLDLSTILNSANVPEREHFNKLARTKGLRHALAWRDSRYEADL